MFLVTVNNIRTMSIEKRKIIVDIELYPCRCQIHVECRIFHQNTAKNANEAGLVILRGPYYRKVYKYRGEKKLRAEK